MKLALFDLDGTLLPGDSDHAFGMFLSQQGWVDAKVYARRNDDFFKAYEAGNLDMHAYVDFTTGPWRDRPIDDIDSLSRRFMAEVVEPMIRPAARELVERHRAQGDRLALVTATNDYITAPIARAFGFETLIATELERDACGRVTGRILGVPNLREGKITKVQAWLAAEGLSLASFDAVTFYSDSTNDLPLMEQVSHPVATNPGPTLAAIASQRGWPVLNLFA